MRDFANTDDFRRLVLERGRELYRDLPWRRTHDPYGIWVSEVMLQQTQVARVDGRWQRWLARFPSIDALANAEVADVLEEWQGMGYNRRALSLRAAAQAMVDGGGEMPSDERELVALPGIGPATAAGIRAFAFDLPATYLETNVRTVFLHELFSDAEDVPDSALLPLVRETCPKDACNPDDDPRTWYYALLDYGAHLKRTVPNPSRRSRSHVRQSRFEGSHRQKRAGVVRLLLEARQLDGGLTPDQVVDGLSQAEVAAGREMPDPREILGILDELAAEGFCSLERGTWRV
ncbi:MAG: adenine glycosylase [Atopobiaceae bacterium]|nr:adenine glycosylase [Atopobiaceae bacterium]